MQVKEALRTLHPDTCFLNHEDHERRNTMHDTGCTMQVKEASLTLFPDPYTLFFRISHSSFIRFGVGR